MSATQIFGWREIGFVQACFSEPDVPFGTRKYFGGKKRPN
jgi:hypothetical protein